MTHKEMLVRKTIRLNGFVGQEIDDLQGILTKECVLGQTVYLRAFPIKLLQIDCSLQYTFAKGGNTRRNGDRLQPKELQGIRLDLLQCLRQLKLYQIVQRLFVIQILGKESLKHLQTSILQIDATDLRTVMESEGTHLCQAVRELDGRQLFTLGKSRCTDALQACGGRAVQFRDGCFLESISSNGNDGVIFKLSRDCKRTRGASTSDLNATSNHFAFKTTFTEGILCGGYR